MKKNKKILSNISTASLLATIISTQFFTISCTSVNDDKEIKQNNILLKEENSIKNIEEKSKLSNVEREEEKNKQIDNYSHLSIEYINDYLIKNANISLKQYFINYNLMNNFVEGDFYYIDPDLGIRYVEDILNGKILIKDIQNTFDDYKNNNHQEYVENLKQINLTEEQVEDAKNIEEIAIYDKEDEQLDSDFEDAKNENFVDHDAIQNDEMFKLNNKYKDGDEIFIDFKMDKNGFFDYKDENKLESRYVYEHDNYFDSDLEVTIAMSDGTKITIPNFDIYSLEWEYNEWNFIKCERETKLNYDDKVVYKKYRNWWNSAYETVSKMSYKFKKLEKILITEKDYLITKNKNNNKTYNVSFDKKTHNFVMQLENKLMSMQSYYNDSKKLNEVSDLLFVVTSSLAVTFTVTSFFTFGATAGHAVALTIQSGALAITNSLTKSELIKTKSKLDKYWDFYNSDEYDILFGLFQKYDDYYKNSINLDGKIIMTIKIFNDHYQLWKGFDNLYKGTDLKIFKKAFELFDNPKEITIYFEKIENIISNFKNIRTLGLEKISQKISKKFFNSIGKIVAKETEERIICLSTAWASPVVLIIDAFDLVLTILSICNDIFYELL